MNGLWHCSKLWTTALGTTNQKVGCSNHSGRTVSFNSLGLIASGGIGAEVGCWMHARRYVFKALESDEPHMGPALHLIARLYRVEERAKALSLSANERLALRQRVSAADRQAPS